MKWAAIFDLDGLLVDSEPLQARSFNIILEPYGIRLETDDFRDLVGYTTTDNFKVLKARHEQIDKSVDQLMEAKDRAYHKLVHSDLVPNPGARELVQSLSARQVPLAVASSSPRRDVELSLNAVGLTPCFAAVLTADDVVETKPAPDLYLLAARALGISPEWCVAFEDSGAGCAAACAAGMHCFVVPHEFTRGQDFSRATGLLRSLEEVTVERLEALFSSRLPPVVA